MANNQGDDLLQEIKNENRKLAEFISEIDEKIKKTDAKLAKAILGDDLKTIEIYKNILHNKKSE